MAVVGYIRVSFDGPVDGFLTHETQQRLIERAAERLGERVRAIAADEGEAADALEARLGLAHALALLRERAVTTMVVARLDRLHADLVGQELILADVRLAGGSVVSADPLDAAALSDRPDDGRALIRRVLDEVGRHERTMRDLRVRYRVAKSPLPADREQASLSRIEALSDQGLHLREISQALAAEGYPPRLSHVFDLAGLRRIVDRIRRGRSV